MPGMRSSRPGHLICDVINAIFAGFLKKAKVNDILVKRALDTSIK